MNSTETNQKTKTFCKISNTRMALMAARQSSLNRIINPNLLSRKICNPINKNAN